MTELNKSRDNIEKLKKEISDLHKELSIKKSNIYELEGMLDKNRYFNKNNNNILADSKIFESFDSFLHELKKIRKEDL